MTSKRVVLILGNGPVADQTAKLAESEGSTVVYGCAASDKTDPSLDTTSFNISDYLDYLSIFQNTINKYQKIDTVILCFSPSQPNQGTYDHKTLDETIYPFVKAVKLTFYHWRRDLGWKKRGAERKVVFLAQYPSGVDTAAQTAYGGILGLYRSTMIRFNVLGIKPEIVSASYDEDPSVVAKALLGASERQTYENGTVSLVNNGSTMTQDPLIGTFTAPQSVKLGIRFATATWLIEKITAHAIQIKAMDKQSIALGSLGVSLLSVLMGYWAVSWRSPWLGLIAGLLGSRFGIIWLRLL